jgi:hypothetical protein
VSGNLQSGGVASVQIGNTAWAGSGYRMEIYGDEGTLVAVSVDSPQLKVSRCAGVPSSRTRKTLPTKRQEPARISAS